jgi:hypothetical protein
MGHSLNEFDGLVPNTQNMHPQKHSVGVPNNRWDEVHATSGCFDIAGSGQLTIHAQRRGVHSTDTYLGTARVVGFCYRRNRIPKP